MHAGRLESTKDAKELLKAQPRATLGSNIDDKNACFLINYKILVTRDIEKQTPLLARYKHATIV